MSEEIRPMTPTEEEAELARVNDLAKDVFRRLEIVTDDALDRVWADPGDYLWDCLDMRFSLNGAFGVTQERWTMRDVMFAFASAALAAGYVKRNDALEEAAKVADEEGETYRKLETDPSSEVRRTAREYRGERQSIAARIRALKAKT